MFFPFFNNKRKQTLAEPFPDEWHAYIDANVLLSRWLSTDEQGRLRDIAKVLVREKYWEGCNGLELTDEIRVTVAAQAALLLIGIDHDYYENVELILMYPSSYTAVELVNAPGRVVSEVPVDRLGEAWSGDLPIVLAWPDALAGGRNENDGRNVVLHEFAHKLDNHDGRGDGVPRLRSDSDYDRWSQVMSAEFNNLVHQSEHHHPTLLNQYGATNAAEFFAVLTECFFERPLELRHHHPDLYSVVKNYYGQDPAAARHR